MALNRTFVHVAGPPGSGKTELIQRLLDKNTSHRLGALRVEPAELEGAEFEEVRDGRPELRRFDTSGAATAAVIRHDPDGESVDGLWSTDAVGFDYTEALVFEGEFPCRFPPDLEVFVAPPLPEDRPLVQERHGEQSAEDRPDELGSGPVAPGEILQFLEAEPGESDSVAERLADRMRQSVARSSKYRFADGYEGIRSARVVAINVRNDDERERGEALAEQIRDLRRDDELYEELLAPGGDRRQIKIRVVDLADPDDTGITDLVRRIEREFDRR